MIDQFFKSNRSERYIEISLWVWYNKGKFHVSKENNDFADQISFTFWEMNSSSFDSMESECLEEFTSINGEHFLMKNSMRMKMFYLRYMFRSWSFDEIMTFQNDGGLDDISFNKLMSLHPMILREIAQNASDYSIGEEDEAEIIKQSHLLFKKNSSVCNPHRMISLYCTLSDMWSKFGLNYFDLKKMPIYEKNALKKIISIEKQIESQEIKMKELQSRGKRNR